jgi:hypothetical protein
VAAPNLSELAQKRFEVVRSPDGRITNYLDKQTGRTLSQTEFNSFMQQQAGLPGGLQALDPNSIGSIMGRANEMLPYAQQLGLGQPGVLPLDQERPNVLGGAVSSGGKGVMSSQQRAASEAQSVAWTRIQTARTPAEKIAAQQQYAQAWADLQTAKGGQQVPYGFSGMGEQAPVPEFPLATRPTVRGNANPIGPQGTITPSSGAQTPRLSYEPAPGTALAKRPVIHDAIPEPDMPAPTVRGTPNPIPTQGPLVTPSGSEVLRLTSSVPPFPPPAGRAPMPAMPTPPPAGAPPAAVKSWFGKLSGKQKAALGAVGAGVGYAVMNKAADTARKQPASAGQPDVGASQGGWDITGGLVDTAVTNALKPSQQPKAAPMPSRAANVLRAASAAQGQAAPQQNAAGAAASGGDKVPVTTSGRPDYNYYAEIMNAADRNDAYARDLINLKEQARMAAIDAGARGEKFRFVPVKDYMNNRIIFVNAGGNDVVLDMNDPRQGVEYQKLIEKSGVDSATMTDWIHRSSKPMLRYMQPVGGNRDVTPDFGYMRRSVEVGQGKPAAPAAMATQAPASAMKQSGNIDVNNRPVVKNADGSISTVRSMSIGTPEGEVLIPTISPDGRVLSENEAIDLFRKTGKHLGIFNTPEQATEYAKQLSSRQGQTYGNASTSEMPTPTATPPTRPAPQPTSVAAVDNEYPKNIATRPEQANPYEFERNPRRNMELDWSQSTPPMQTVADRTAQLGSSVGDVNEQYRRLGNYDYDTETYKPSMTPMEDALATNRLQNKMVSNLGKKRRK